MVGMVFSLIFDEARRIWCYRWLVAATAAIIFLLAAAYIVTMPNVYDAWGQILVNKGGSLAAATEGVTLDKDEGGTSVVENTLLNDQSLERVVLAINPEAKSFSKGQMESAVNSLRGGIRVSAQSESDFVEIHYKNTDPVKARDVTQILLNRFISDSVGRSQGELDQAGRFLDQQIASYEKMMLDSQVAMANFRRANPSVARLAQTGPIGGVMSEMPSAGGGGVVYRTVEGGGSTAPAAFSAPQDGAIADLQGRLATLRTQYTEEYPDVVATKRQIANLQAERARSAAAYAANPPARVASPARQRVVVSGGGTGVRAAPVVAPNVGAQWAELRRKDELLGTNYQALIARREATKMSQAALASQSLAHYQITRQAALPTVPVGPPRTLYLWLALVVAIGAGLAAAYLRGAVNGIFVSPRELEDACQLPVIGTVSWEPAWHTGTVARASRTLPIVASLGFVAVVALAFLLAR